VKSGPAVLSAITFDSRVYGGLLHLGDDMRLVLRRGLDFLCVFYYGRKEEVFPNCSAVRRFMATHDIGFLLLTFLIVWNKRTSTGFLA